MASVWNARRSSVASQAHREPDAVWNDDFYSGYWSFDPKRDLNWRAITALHKARGVAKQGPKLSANQLAARLESIYAAELSKEANARKLKGEARTTWMLQQLGRDLRTDERELRRILTKSRDGN